MLGGHSVLDPLLPIPNRTVKRDCADDSADSRVKVGHRQAPTKTRGSPERVGLLFLWGLMIDLRQDENKAQCQSGWEHGCQSASRLIAFARLVSAFTHIRVANVM